MPEFILIVWLFRDNHVSRICCTNKSIHHIVPHVSYNSREPDTKNPNSTFVLCQSVVFRDNRVFLTNTLTPTSGLSSGVKHLSILSEISICSTLPPATFSQLIRLLREAPRHLFHQVIVFSSPYHMRFIIHEGLFTQRRFLNKPNELLQNRLQSQLVRYDASINADALN